MSKIQWKAEASGLSEKTEAVAKSYTQNINGVKVLLDEHRGKFKLLIDGEHALSWTGDNEEDIEGVVLGKSPEALAEFFLASLIK